VQLESELKVLQAKTKEELKISPENEMRIRELDENKTDVEMEFKELSEKVEHAMAINKDLENKWEGAKNKRNELHDKIHFISHLIVEYKSTREKEIKDFQGLEDESKSIKIDLERLNLEIQDKEKQGQTEKRLLEEKKMELIDIKKENDKFEYNKRKIETQISEKKREKSDWE